MLVSTKGRYALRVMVDLAEHAADGYLPMKDVAQRQEVSLKYLEQIMPVLTRGGLVDAVHGKGGGYRLKKPPQEITAGEVLRLTEGCLAPVSCLAADAAPCSRASDCRTLGMWKKFYEMSNAFFDGITLRDLMKE